MGALVFAGRIVIVVVNVIFAILALLLIVLGFILRFAQGYLRSYIDQVLSEIQSCVQNYYGDTGFSAENFELGEMLIDLATFIIIMGVLLMALCVLGFVGACCSIKTVILIYAIIVGVILITQIVMAILVFGYPDTIKNAVKPKLQSFLDDYDGIRGEGYTLGMNVMMQNYQCCGVDNKDDFEKTKGKWKQSNKDGDKVVTPVACCKKLPGDDTKRRQCAGDTDISTDVSSLTDNNYNKGCVDAVYESVDEVCFIYFKIAVAFCCIAEAVLIIFSILIWRDEGLKGLIV